MNRDLMCPKCRSMCSSRAKKGTECPSCKTKFKVSTSLRMMEKERQAGTPPESAPSESGHEKNASVDSPKPQPSGKSIWDELGPPASDPDILQGATAAQGDQAQPEKAQGEWKSIGPPEAPSIGPGPLVDGNALMFEILNLALMVILTGEKADMKKLAELGGKALSLMANFTIAPSGLNPIELPAWVPLVAVFAVALILPVVAKLIQEKLGGLLGGLMDKFSGIFDKKKADAEAPAEAGQAMA